MDREPTCGSVMTLLNIDSYETISTDMWHQNKNHIPSVAKYLSDFLYQF
jgi:hypothetical protein